MAAANIQRSKRRRGGGGEAEGIEDGIQKQILKVENLIPKAKQGQLSTYITADFRRHIVASRIAREEATGKSKGYGFIRFDSNSIAERCLRRCHRKNKSFQLSWADDLHDVPEDILQARQEPLKLPPTSSKTELPKLYDNWPSNPRDGNQTIRFDNLEPWVDVEDVQLFIPSPFREQIYSLLLKENGETWESEGYCFVRFAFYAVAACFLYTYNGKQIPGTNMTYQLSWAPFRTYIDKRPDNEEMKDSNDKEEKDICVARTMSRVAVDPPNKECDSPPHRLLLGPIVPTDQDYPKDTIFIGAVDPNFKEDELRQIFSNFGPLACVQINHSRGCGLIQFKAKEAAQSAMQELPKLVHENKIGFIGWGRSEEMKGNVFFNPVLNRCSDFFRSSTWSDQGNPVQASFSWQSSATGAHEDFKLRLSGVMGPPPRLEPFRCSFNFGSLGISRIVVMHGSVPQRLLYPLKTIGAPTTSRVDAPGSVDPQDPPRGKQ